MSHHESVWASLKKNKRNLKKPNPNPYSPVPNDGEGLNKKGGVRQIT